MNNKISHKNRNVKSALNYENLSAEISPNKASINGFVNGNEEKKVKKSSKKDKKSKVIENQSKDIKSDIECTNHKTEDSASSKKNTGSKKKKNAAKVNVTNEPKEESQESVQLVNSEVLCTAEDLIANFKDVTLNEELCDTVNNSETKNPEPTTQLEEPKKPDLPPVEYVQYESELQMPMIMKLIQKDLSEPYSIYTYRYFIHNWPKLCFLAMCEDKCVGAIVCKLDWHRKVIKRGYIAMLAVDQQYRKRGIGSTLVRRAIQEMIAGEADEVVLETEITNKPALQLYEALGFVRDKRLFRYYLNGVDALRLKLWLR